MAQKSTAVKKKWGIIRDQPVELSASLLFVPLPLSHPSQIQRRRKIQNVVT